MDHHLVSLARGPRDRARGQGASQSGPARRPARGVSDAPPEIHRDREARDAVRPVRCWHLRAAASATRSGRPLPARARTTTVPSASCGDMPGCVLSSPPTTSTLRSTQRQPRTIRRLDTPCRRSHRAASRFGRRVACDRERTLAATQPRAGARAQGGSVRARRAPRGPLPRQVPSPIRQPERAPQERNPLPTAPHRTTDESRERAVAASGCADSSAIRPAGPAPRQGRGWCGRVSMVSRRASLLLGRLTRVSGHRGALRTGIPER
jgi:hypothetical protein